MKNMLKLLVLFFTVFLVFPAVPAPGQTSGENPEEPEIITVSEDVRILRYYSARGTRSEARHHYLEIEGERIPDVFSKVVYKGLPLHFSDPENITGETTDTSGDPMLKSQVFHPPYPQSNWREDGTKAGNPSGDT